jgi:hypothetical protein
VTGDWALCFNYPAKGDKMQSKAKTVAEYLKELPADRRTTISEVRKIIRKNLPKGYRETMNWGMISYEIPLKTYPETYNKKPLMYAALASQKQYNSLYLSCAYQDSKQAKRLKEGFQKAGKKLNMGKSCVRFKSLDDLPLNVIAESIGAVTPDAFIKQYERARKTGRC